MGYTCEFDVWIELVGRDVDKENYDIVVGLSDEDVKRNDVFAPLFPNEDSDYFHKDLYDLRFEVSLPGIIST